MSCPPTPTQERLEWRETAEGLHPVVVRGTNEIPVAWAPQPGSAVAFLSCPVQEALIEGPRGTGKSDVLIMSFAQHVGRGYGQAWRGILFRKTYPELQDIIQKSFRWFPRIWPQAVYNRSEHYWQWPDGEVLFFRHFAKEHDYWSYHGHEYPAILWEELTNWASANCYKSMFACNRSTHVGLPLIVRATCNPYGVGHNWVKSRWRLPVAAGYTVGPVIRDATDRDGNPEPERVAVHGTLEENRVLLHAQPNYLTNIRAAARNPAELRAWVHGDWNIIAGGMLDDVWQDHIHVLPDFPLIAIPRGWYVDRAYDHGSSKPFSAGWYAQSNGEPLVYGGRKYGPIPGDLIRVAEWYGQREGGDDNEGVRLSAAQIGRGIADRERDWGLVGRVKPGPADTNIFDDYEPNRTIAKDMATVGVKWVRADKGPGSRKQGWELVRSRLRNALDSQRDEPALFVLERCVHFRRTVPVLPRSDLDLDDVDTDAEDHCGDELRYRLRHKPKVIATGAW